MTHGASRAAPFEKRGRILINVLIIGNGRMGTIIQELVDADPDMQVVGVIGLENKDDLAGTAPAADVAIDFSHKSMLDLVETYVNRTHAALVSGTTGYDDGEMARLHALGEVAPVIHAANYSLGVAVLKRLAAEAAQALDGWDIEIVETHHNQKVDAPSGTANLLLKAVDPQGECEVAHGREGFTGARPAKQIGMHALRGGTVAGLHEVHFFGQDEEVTLTHRATSRRIFATGAVAAAKKLVTKDAGFYTFDQLMFE